MTGKKPRRFSVVGVASVVGMILTGLAVLLSVVYGG